ncbi:hypothetical protein [Pseudoclavibacter helvolus]|uniref:hypothetical protein n=1 Tax=Pseudoclavibacter helvolus TaxID=255205 RepID=UPI0012E84863|nr:hypothetical protein [Pseudoclavibacter helvolus]
MLDVAARARDRRSRRIRVNAVIVGSRAIFPEAAYIITVLCSSRSALISGAFIPADDGELLENAL